MTENQTETKFDPSPHPTAVEAVAASKAAEKVNQQGTRVQEVDGAAQSAMIESALPLSFSGSSMPKRGSW